MADSDMLRELKQLNESMASIRRLLRVCAATLVGIACVSADGSGSSLGGAIAVIVWCGMAAVSWFVGELKKLGDSK